MYLRPIMLNVDFEYREENKILPKLIYLLKAHLKKGESLSKLLVLETDFNIPSNILNYMKDPSRPGYLDPFKFELYIYRRMYYAIDHGTLFCNNSVSFKNLQVDLVSDETASKANEIASKFGYPKIPEYCDSRLDELCEELDEAWIKTNENIKNGINENIKIREDEDCNKFWHLTYEAQPKIEENSFFEDLEQIEVAQIIGYIADKTGFWKAFTHVKPKYSKKNLDKEAVKAGILADALGFGISGMSEICDIGYNTLEVNHNNYIRISTLKDASVEVANYIYPLPIFPVWNIEEDMLFADVDGQKHETRGKTIQSRYSSKYFGQTKGISLLSAIVNHYSVNIKAISANDHESHSMFDMVRGNQTDIPIHKVTGDSHSVNQLNFIALDAINVKFVPCLKSIQEQAENIYCVGDSEQYEGLIKPKGKVNLNLIRKNKNDIIKVLLSLILQENSQTVIIKKLSSHKRYSRLKSALWEYNKIFRSIHILNLIDDLTLRQNIKKARNRTEAYHQQQKMIRDVYDGMLKGKKIVENQLQAEAIRLVANCIIAYNTILLNDLYLSMVEKYGELEAKKIMSRTSPVAWRHIILTGKYSFKSSKSKLNIEQHVEKMKSYIHEHLATKQGKMGVLP